MRKSFLLGAVVLLSIMVSLPANAIDRQSLASYASALNGKKKAELKTAIYNKIKNPTTLNYGGGNKKTWWGFYHTDRIPETNECVNRYSARKFYFLDDFTLTYTAISEMNIAHSFPSSWWGGSTSVSAYKDLYNLYPSDSKANNSKQNYPMGVVTQIDKEEEGYDKVGRGTIDGVSNIWCWEPGDQYKGDFARAYMYMATCYQDLTWKLYNDNGTKTSAYYQLQQDTWPTLKQWAYTLYLQWLKSDPVDELEIDRNNAVNDIQGNRNLFVDYPYLAEYVWGDSVDVAFNPYSSISTASDDDRYLSAVPSGVSMPTFSPDGGTYTEPVTVEISCTTPNVTIYYTTDESSPKDGDNVYTGPITVDKTTTLKAVAKDANGNFSNVATAIYIIYNVTTDFKETFDQCDGTGGNDEQFGGNVASSTFKPDNVGWTANNKYGGDKCARFGNSSGASVVTTPTFVVNGTSTFSFKAAPWGTDGKTLKLSVTGDATLSETSLTMEEGKWTEYVLTLTGSGEVSISFTPAKRFFLDEVMAVSIAGDVNKDGRVDISDVTALIDIVLGKDSTQPYQNDHDAADVNDDDNIDISDVTALIDIILGK